MSLGSFFLPSSLSRTCTLSNSPKFTSSRSRPRRSVMCRLSSGNAAELRLWSVRSRSLWLRKGRIKFLIKMKGYSSVSALKLLINQTTYIPELQSCLARYVVNIIRTPETNGFVNCRQYLVVCLDHQYVEKISFRLIFKQKIVSLKIHQIDFFRTQKL